MPSKWSMRFFKNSLILLKCFGIWGGRNPSKFYKFYSVVYLFITFFCYMALLTLNLVCTPQNIELIIQEITFYFTEINVMIKTLWFVTIRGTIIEIFNIIDCDEFLGDYKNENGIIQTSLSKYKCFWKLYIGMAHISFSSLIFVPILWYIIRGTVPELPICKYYFLSDEDRREYYIFLYIYQSFCIYGHMLYNLNIDTFVAGLFVIAIVQLRLLNIKLTKIKLSKQERNILKELQDYNSTLKLKSCLRHYDTILRYYKLLQVTSGVIMFSQYCVGSTIICIAMCELLQPYSTEKKIFLVIYLYTMTLQIFIPSLLGTYLSHESQELCFAAYSSEWIPRSQKFKATLHIFMERTQTPLAITGLKFFSLTLVTFTSIMKSAFSLFTLMRSFQEQ